MTATMVSAVTASLKAAQTQPEDAAARLLAMRYAAVIDAQAEVDEATDGKVDALLEFGPKLLAVLTALGATPAGRKNEKGGGGSVSNLPSPLQALRDAARARTATALDAPAS